MPISVTCSCGKSLKAPDKLAGKKAKCPACGGVVEIPAPEPEVVELDEAAYDAPPPEAESRPPRARRKRPGAGARGRKPRTRTKTARPAVAEGAMEGDAKPWWMWLLGPGFLFAGLLCSWMGCGMISKAGEVETWPTVQGTIKETTLVEYEDRDSGDAMWTIEVSYTYEVDGKSYSSDQISPGPESRSSSRSEWVEEARKYPMGGTHVVYYNPGDHSEAFLDPSAGGGAVIIVIVGLVFALIGGGLTFVKIQSVRAGRR